MSSRTDLQKDELVAALCEMGFNDMLGVIHRALGHLAIKKINLNDGLPDDIIFLVARVTYEEAKVGTITICASGLTDAANPDFPTESGWCPRCEALLLSVSKKAVCPVCGYLPVELT